MNKKNVLFYIVILFLTLFLTLESSFAAEQLKGEKRLGTPIERAKGEELSAAVGHFARARSLLIAALREFDKGTAKVDPSALINVEQWRNTLIDRAEDITKVLDPQPRASETGVRYNPDSRLLGNSSR